MRDHREYKVAFLWQAQKWPKLTKTKKGDLEKTWPDRKKLIGFLDSDFQNQLKHLWFQWKKFQTQHSVIIEKDDALQQLKLFSARTKTTNANIIQNNIKMFK